jgi:hypothetical protein
LLWGHTLQYDWFLTLGSFTKLSFRLGDMLWFDIEVNNKIKCHNEGIYCDIIEFRNNFATWTLKNDNDTARPIILDVQATAFPDPGQAPHLHGLAESGTAPAREFTHSSLHPQVLDPQIVLQPQG